MRYRLRALLIVAVASVISLMAWLVFFAPSANLLREFRLAARNVDSLRLFEGMPHQFYEEDEFAAERNRPDVVQLHSYPFYSPPLDIEGLLKGDEVLQEPWFEYLNCLVDNSPKHNPAGHWTTLRMAPKFRDAFLAELTTSQFKP